MKKITSIAVAFTALLAVSSAKAQNPVLQGLANVANYVAENGELRSGVGGTFAEVGKAKLSPVMIQQLTVYSHNFAHTGVDIGPVHTTCFSGDKNHEGVGIGFGWKLLDVDWLKDFKFPALKLAELRIGGSVSVDVDQALQGKVSQRSAVAAVTMGWKF